MASSVTSETAIRSGRIANKLYRIVLHFSLERAHSLHKGGFQRLTASPSSTLYSPAAQSPSPPRVP